jgi:hypothetical protein
MAFSQMDFVARIANESTSGIEGSELTRWLTYRRS